MNGIEIKSRIDANNKLIEERIQPMVFTLNKEVCSLMEENAKLREQCPHEYENHICKYCYKEEITE